MNHSHLMRVSAEMLRSCSGIEVEESSGGLSAITGGEPTLVVAPRGLGVVVLLRPWLAARPRASDKLLHVDVGEDDWEALYTESEWHVRGVVSRALDRIESRLSLTDRLEAHLAGRAKTVPVGPETAEYWKALAKWGKETESISPSDRRFAWMYAERLERRLKVSDKFAAWARRKATEVAALGFVGPDKDVIR